MKNIKRKYFSQVVMNGSKKEVLVPAEEGIVFFPLLIDNC